MQYHVTLSAAKSLVGEGRFLEKGRPQILRRFTPQNDVPEATPGYHKPKRLGGLASFAAGPCRYQVVGDGDRAWYGENVALIVQSKEYF